MPAPADVTEDGNNSTSTPAERWATKISKAEREFGEWFRKCERIEQIYTDQRQARDRTTRRYAILWANTEVLRPTVYSRPPNPTVTRRFRDKDPVGRQVADVMERALISQFELNDADNVFRDVRDDFVMCSRGSAWVRYEVAFGDDDPDEVVGEDVIFDHVHYSDLVHPRRRKWRDVPWVARRVHMDKDALKQRFGEEKAKLVAAAQSIGAKPEVQSETTRAGGQGQKRDTDTIEVFEVWDKPSRRVYWVVKGVSEFMDDKEPLLKTRGFFPCPRPAYGTLATNSLEPVPDYRYYQDQADEVNDLTDKISILTQQLKLVGWYPAGMPGEVSTAIEQAASAENRDMLIPIAGWTEFTTGGGARELIQWWPVGDVLTALQGAYQARRELISDIFQITGISDIVRGDTDPDETLGAQRLKSQFGAVRVREKQQEIQRFIRDMTRLAAEVISELFTQQVLQAITGIALPTQAELETKVREQALLQAQGGMPDQGQVFDVAAMAGPGGAAPGQGGADPGALMAAPDQNPAMQQVTWEQVIEVMRDDRMRTYRVEIETDSTLEPDEMAEKTSRNEFLQVVAEFFERAAPIIAAQPAMGRMLGEMLMFQVRAYRVGRQLEQIIEETMDQIIQESQQAAQQPPPTPPEVQVEQMRQEAKQIGDELGARLKMTQMQNDAQLTLRTNEMKAIQERDAATRSHQLDREKVAAELELMRFKAQAELDLQREKQANELQVKLEGLRNQALQAQTAESNGEEGASDQFNSIVTEIRTAIGEFASALTAPRDIIRDGAGQILGSAPRFDNVDGGQSEFADLLASPTEIVRDDSGTIIGSRPVRPTTTSD